VVVVILNPASGIGVRHPADEIAGLFLQAGRRADVITLAKGQDPATVAKDAAARAPVVVAAGGDGTVSGVAAGVLESQATLGVLPLGTLNHFARDLRLPLDLGKAIATIVAGRAGSVDVGQVNGRFFLNNSSIGLYPNILELRDDLRRAGHRKWPAMAVATTRVVGNYRGLVVNIVVDGRARVWRTPFVFIGNNEYTVEGMHPGVRARVNGGRLFAYLTPRLRARELPLLLGRALLGRAMASGAFEIVPAGELVVDTPDARRIRVACDGELVTMATPLKYRVCAGALKVILP
jgi:diacylglycerol kinase family enzyme